MVKTNDESLIVCMPVYDKIHPLAWMADMQLSAQLARRFPKGKLAFLTERKLTQPHSENCMCNRANGLRAKDGKKFDWLLWIEDDTLPPPDAFDVLRAQADPVERPVIHALSFDRQDWFDPSIWEKAEVAGDDKFYMRPIRNWEPNKLYRVVHSGVCCSLFHMSVWDKLKRPWFKMQPFDHSVGVGLTPCQALSQRFYEADIPMYGYTGCIAGHVGDELIVTADVSRAHQRRLNLEHGGGVKRFV